jgi:hypothetical protein
MISRIKILAFALSLLMSNLLKAEVTFDGFSEGLYASIDESGFRVAQLPAFFILEGARSCFPPCVDNGTPYLATQNGLAPVRVEPSKPLPFVLSSFDLGEQHIDRPFCPEVVVTGFQGALIVASANVELDGINDAGGPLDDFQHVVLPAEFRGLTSVEFACTTFRRYSLDRLELSYDDPAIIPALSATGACALSLLLMLAAALALRRR